MSSRSEILLKKQVTRIRSRAPTKQGPLKATETTHEGEQIYHYPLEEQRLEEAERLQEEALPAKRRDKKLSRISEGDEPEEIDETLVPKAPRDFEIGEAEEAEQVEHSKKVGDGGYEIYEAAVWKQVPTSGSLLQRMKEINIDYPSKVERLVRVMIRKKLQDAQVAHGTEQRLLPELGAEISELKSKDARLRIVGDQRPRLYDDITPELIDPKNKYRPEYGIGTRVEFRMRNPEYIEFLELYNTRTLLDRKKYENYVETYKIKDGFPAGPIATRLADYAKTKLEEMAKKYKEDPGKGYYLKPFTGVVILFSEKSMVVAMDGIAHNEFVMYDNPFLKVLPQKPIDEPIPAISSTVRNVEDLYTQQDIPNALRVAVRNGYLRLLNTMILPTPVAPTSPKVSVIVEELVEVEIESFEEYFSHEYEKFLRARYELDIYEHINKEMIQDEAIDHSQIDMNDHTLLHSLGVILPGEDPRSFKVPPLALSVDTNINEFIEHLKKLDKTLLRIHVLEFLEKEILAGAGGGQRTEHVIILDETLKKKESEEEPGQESEESEKIQKLPTQQRDKRYPVVVNIPPVSGNKFATILANAIEEYRRRFPVNIEVYEDVLIKRIIDNEILKKKEDEIDLPEFRDRFETSLEAEYMIAEERAKERKEQARARHEESIRKKEEDLKELEEKIERLRTATLEQEMREIEREIFADEKNLEAIKRSLEEERAAQNRGYSSENEREVAEFEDHIFINHRSTLSTYLYNVLYPYVFMDSPISPYAKFFRAKLGNGDFRFSSLITANLARYLPELSMRLAMTPKVDLDPAYNIINVVLKKLVDQVLQGYIDSTDPFSKREAETYYTHWGLTIDPLVKLLVIPADVCHKDTGTGYRRVERDGKYVNMPYTDEPLLEKIPSDEMTICYSNGKFSCHDIRSLLRLFSTSESPINQYTGQPFPKDFEMRIRQRYADILGSKAPWLEKPERPEAKEMLPITERIKKLALVGDYFEGVREHGLVLTELDVLFQELFEETTITFTYDPNDPDVSAVVAGFDFKNIGKLDDIKTLLIVDQKPTYIIGINAAQFKEGGDKIKRELKTKFPDTTIFFSDSDDPTPALKEVVGDLIARLANLIEPPIEGLALVGEYFDDIRESGLILSPGESVTTTDDPNDPDVSAIVFGIDFKDAKKSVGLKKLVEEVATSGKPIYIIGINAGAFKWTEKKLKPVEGELGQPSTSKHPADKGVPPRGIYYYYSSTVGKNMNKIKRELEAKFPETTIFFADASDPTLALKEVVGDIIAHRK